MRWAYRVCVISLTICGAECGLLSGLECAMSRTSPCESLRDFNIARGREPGRNLIWPSVASLAPGQPCGPLSVAGSPRFTKTFQTALMRRSLAAGERGPSYEEVSAMTAKDRLVEQNCKLAELRKLAESKR
jgi:hypothetical protein